MSTNQEYVLTDTDLIVSKTDLIGIITYINDDFVRIGGFSRSELIGQPHSILRHSDMPKLAYADLWKTLKAGNSWTGIVKNRTKQGGFYWVRANIMPLWENNKVIGYMSVRNKASSAEINAAATLYREIQAGQSKVKLDAGEVIQPSFIRATRRAFNNMMVKTKLVTLVTIAILSLAGVAGYGDYGLNIIKNASEESMHEIDAHAKGVNLSRAVQVEFKSQVQDWKNMLLRGQNPATFEKYSKSFDDEGAKVTQQLAELKQTMIDMPEKEVIALVDTAISNHNDMMTKYHAARATYQTDNPASIFAVDAMVKGIDNTFVDEIEKLVTFHQSEIEKHIKEGKAIPANVISQFQTSVILIAMSIASVLLAWSIATLWSVLTPIKKATDLIQKMSEGTSVQVNEFSKNELGHLMQALKMMGIKFGFEASEERRTSADMLRIKMALDAVRVPVTLSNSQKELIYMNEAAQLLWGEMAGELSKRFPNFTVAGMYDKPLVNYLETEEERLEFAEQRKEPKIMFMGLGGKNFRATVISVYDNRGMYVGRATQWKDITLELAMQNQISRIVNDANNGNFRNRVQLNDSTGFFKELADGLNILLSTCERSYGDIAAIFDALSQGDLTRTITNDYSGEFKTIKNNANDTVQKLTEIVEQIKRITHNVNSSSREIAGSNNDLSIRTTSQAAAIQETATSMHELTTTVSANTDNANHANEFVIGASDIATKGVNVIRRVVSTMEEIHESSRKVVDIISVIDGISFQTNILALNAAVEAARAGEQGRGFAVVASEVRSLAQRAAAAAGEIKTLINDSVEKIEDGSKLVIDAGHTMEDIVGSIRTVTGMIGQINIASSEQSTGIEQANMAVLEMEQMTQQNETLVKQSAVTANNLRNQADDLSRAVDYFNIR